MATFLVVEIDMTGVPIILPKPLFAFVERSLTATGPWVRIGQVALADDVGYFYDNTVPYDTQVWYRGLWVTPPGPEFANSPTGPFTLVGSGNVVLSDPIRPWADIEFGFCATPEELNRAACVPGGIEFVWSRFGSTTRRVDAGLFDRLNSETPADIYARRKNLDSGARILTKSLDAIDQMYELFTAGGPLYLRAPAAYGRADYYVQPGDLIETHLSDLIDQRFPHRLWDFPYTVVDAVIAVQQGTDCANWCAVEDAFPTFADLTATGDTWADVATGATVCP
jgi:hypothetical protein